MYTEDKFNIFAKGDRFDYTFSKHSGNFTSIIIDGEEKLAGESALSAFRAPTDNAKKLYKAKHTDELIDTPEN